MRSSGDWSSTVTSFELKEESNYSVITELVED